MRVPWLSAAGCTAPLAPPSTAIVQALSAPRLRLVMDETADRADRGQRLAAKAEMIDAQEIVVGELRGAMTLDRQRQLVAIHADAVVADDDEALPAFLQRDVDAGRAGIDRVLDQLFERGRRTLDDLAGGDAIDERFRQKANRHAAIVPPGAPSRQGIAAR